MSFGRVIAVGLIAIGLTGCAGAMVVKQRNDENEQVKTQIRNTVAGLRTDCQAAMSSSDLNPIREKVELLRPSLTSPTPFAMLVDNSTATDAEKAAILTWGRVRQKCVERERDFYQHLPLPSHMATGIQDQLRSGLVEFGDGVAQAINYLIAGLYDDQLTYAQFNVQRVDAGKKEYDALKKWLAVLDAQDKQQTLAEAQAAQAQVNALVGLAKAIGCAKAKGDYAKAACGQ